MPSFSTKFTLSRDYLAECFDQTLPHGRHAKPNYLFPALMLVAGAGLLFFTEQPKVAGSMLIALAVLELIHSRYRRAWWLTRQMWAKSADSEVTLTVGDGGITTQSPYTKTALTWVQINGVIETDLGLILVDKSGRQQYLSKSLFPAELVNEILTTAGQPSAPPA